MLINFIIKKIKLMIQIPPNTDSVQCQWNWISNYILLLPDVCLQWFSDDNSDLTKHL